MGEFADDAIDDIFAFDDLQLQWGHRHPSEMPEWVYDQLYDEFGAAYPPAFSGFTPRSSKPSGPGKCPICGSMTKEKTGRYGKFYGCANYPSCKGSRNA